MVGGFLTSLTHHSLCPAAPGHRSRWPGRRALAPVKGTIPRDAPSIYEVDHPNGSVPATTVADKGAANGNGSGHMASSGLAKQDFGKFVQFFRQASPYVEGHRGKTFVIVVPGGVRMIVAPEALGARPSRADVATCAIGIRMAWDQSSRREVACGFSGL